MLNETFFEHLAHSAYDNNSKTAQKFTASGYQKKPLFCKLLRQLNLKHDYAVLLRTINNKKNSCTWEDCCPWRIPATCSCQERACGALSKARDGWAPGSGSPLGAILTGCSGLWRRYRPEFWSGSCLIPALWAVEAPPIHPLGWCHYLVKEDLIKTMEG